MAVRILVLCALFLAASVYLTTSSEAEPVLIRRPLSTFPMQVGSWMGRETEPMDQRVLSVLGVDDYLNRIYSSGPAQAGVYIGFYQTQRQGSSIHSPLNCLPGAGWNPAHRGYATISM